MPSASHSMLKQLPCSVDLCAKLRLCCSPRTLKLPLPPLQLRVHWEGRDAASDAALQGCCHDCDKVTPLGLLLLALRDKAAQLACLACLSSQRWQRRSVQRESF